MVNANGDLIHFTLQRTADATEEPITLQQAKDWLRVDLDVDDAVIAALITAARQQVERDTGRVCSTQTWALGLDAVPAGAITLPVGPVLSVSSVVVYAPDNTASTVAATVYRLDADSRPARLVLQTDQSWPTDVRAENALVVTFTAGMTASDTAQTPLLQAMLFLVSHWYANREGVAGDRMAELPLAYQMLIASERVVG